MGIETIDIDDITPNSSAMLFDLREDFLLRHGGVCTKVHFDTVEAMDVDAFLKTEVPKLRSTSRSNALFVLRDSITQAVSVIYGNQVIKYNVTNLEDVPLSTLSKFLKSDDDIRYFPNIKYPIIGHVEGSGTKRITVLLQDKRFMFRSSTYPGGPFEIPCYLPPLWFQVLTNNSHALLGVRIACAPESSVDCMDTQLCHLPLPNIFQSSAEVCLGSSHVRVDDTVAITDGVVVQLAIDQVLNSNWNNHLIGSIDYRSIVGTAFSECRSEHKKYIIDRIKRASSSEQLPGLFRVLCVLSEPDGWRLLKFNKLNISTNEFLTCAHP